MADDEGITVLIAGAAVLLAFAISACLTRADPLSLTKIFFGTA
jgi:hypothetical protein